MDGFFFPGSQKWPIIATEYSKTVGIFRDHDHLAIFPEIRPIFRVGRIPSRLAAQPAFLALRASARSGLGPEVSGKWDEFRVGWLLKQRESKAFRVQHSCRKGLGLGGLLTTIRMEFRSIFQVARPTSVARDSVSADRETRIFVPHGANEALVSGPAVCKMVRNPSRIAAKRPDI